MQRLSTMVTALAILLGTFSPGRSNTIEFTDSAASGQVKWRTNTIEVAFSTSLQSPGSNIKPGSDVIGAARRALSRWSTLANVRFIETSSAAQSISPGGNGDGVNLITIADTPENRSIFSGGGMTGKTRISYDSATRAILEADIVINPYPTSEDGTPLQFSTDGTPGTYDLESTFTHEVGHLLGLEHSSVIASTMQPRQAVNGTYKLTAFTERTLSESDRAAVSSLYGDQNELGAIHGKLVKNSPGTEATPLVGAHVWVENSISGRVIASALTSSSGNYQIESVPPGQYRVLTEYANRQTPVPQVSLFSGSDNLLNWQTGFRSAELASQLRVNANEITAHSFAISAQAASPVLMPRLLGANGELSTTPVPADVGKKVTVYVGGEGVDQVPASGISVTSPFMVVDPESLTLEQFGTSFPVIAFKVSVAASAPFGDYSVRLQLNSGEVAYVPGGITVDPGVNSSFANPTDDPRFFVSQHYRDFLGREPDEPGLQYWVGRLAQCKSDVECLRVRRTEVSAAFFLEPEFQEVGSFIYRLYQAALGRQPTFVEFMRDRSVLTSRSSDLEANKGVLVWELVQRPEFLQKYSANLNAQQLVDALLSAAFRFSGSDLFSERTTLMAFDDGTIAGRVAIIQGIVSSQSFAKTHYSRALVLMYYFAYLRRDPDDGAYNFWLNVVNARIPTDKTPSQALVCAFINSAEYQSRFGMLTTHTDKECRVGLPG
jgi:hypothetical protein